MEGAGNDSSSPSPEWFYYGECLRNHAANMGTTATRRELEATDYGRKPMEIFTLEQKERMRDFAEDLGWKMDRRSSEIDQFCYSIKVPRQTFRLSMRRHKNNSASSILASMSSLDPLGPSVADCGNIASSSRPRR